MYTAFLAVAIACGTPSMLAAVALGQLSNLMGCLTTYGIGSAPPYFGAGYVPQVSRAAARRRGSCCSVPSSGRAGMARLATDPRCAPWTDHRRRHHRYRRVPAG